MEAAKAARASTSAAAAAIARAPPSANRAHVYPIAIPVATVERDRAGVSTSGRDVREDQTRRAPAVRDSADEMGDEKDAAGRVPPRRDDATIVDGASASDARIRAGGARMEGGARARVDASRGGGSGRGFGQVVEALRRRARVRPGEETGAVTARGTSPGVWCSGE